MPSVKLITQSQYNMSNVHLSYIAKVNKEIRGTFILLSACSGIIVI